MLSHLIKIYAVANSAIFVSGTLRVKVTSYISSDTLCLFIYISTVQILLSQGELSGSRKFTLRYQ